MKLFTIAATAAASLVLSATAANAATAIVFNGFDAGYTNFSNTVVGAGGTVSLQQLTGGTAPTFTDFSIARTNGGTASVGSPYSLFNASPNRSTSGGVININPAGPNTNPRGNPLDYRNSGITFTFASGINALGFEVGDWSTCCQRSDLFIQFGANAPIMVGSSITGNDQFLTNRGAGVFVAAFDDTSTFNTVSFWGNGVGEFLVAGGTIRYSTIKQGSLPAVPESSTWMMMIVGFGAAGSALRSRRRATIASVA